MVRIITGLLIFFSSLATAKVPTIDDARQKLYSERTHLQAIQAELNEKRNALNVLSEQIETLKKGQRGLSKPGADLESSLKASQRLASEMAILSSQLEAGKNESRVVEEQFLALEQASISALQERITHESDRQKRRELLEQLKSLKLERSKIQSDRFGEPQLVPTEATLTGSDDPDELREQADFLKDKEDAVRRQLGEVERQLLQAKEDRELDLQLRHFSNEEALFEEGDRRGRFDKFTPPVTASAAANGRQSDAPPPAAAPQSNPGGPMIGTTGTGTGAGTGTGTGTTTPAATKEPLIVGTTTHTLSAEKAGAGSATDDLGTVEGLQAAQGKLKLLADELKKKAELLETRAAQLKK